MIFFASHVLSIVLAPVVLVMVAVGCQVWPIFGTLLLAATALNLYLTRRHQ